MPSSSQPISETPITSLQQGDLDGLCSVYSVVNAARLAAREIAPRPVRPRLLFRHLVRRLEQHDLLTEAMICGLDEDRVLMLLDWTAEWTASRWGILYRFSQPFAGAERTSPKRLLGCLESHLSAPNSAAILGVNGGLSHWTCVRSCEEKRLMLLDSSGLRYFGKGIFRRPGRGGAWVRQPTPEGLFLVRAEPAS